MSSKVDGVRSLYELKELIHSGVQPEYLLFFGHRPPYGGIINATCLSQWWQADFVLDDETYRSAEHFMMASKAMLFDDHETAEKIRQDPNPKNAKILGREVAGFDKETWEDHRFDIVVDGNLAKFSQNRKLLKYLLGTGESVLVEASPHDTVWGIGLDRDNKDAIRPDYWRGLNLLGFALMEVREQLRANEG
jgi:ribA/ribD-fused uncharacterized protein